MRAWSVPRGPKAFLMGRPPNAVCEVQMCTRRATASLSEFFLLKQTPPLSGDSSSGGGLCPRRKWALGDRNPQKHHQKFGFCCYSNVAMVILVRVFVAGLRATWPKLGVTQGG